MMKPDLIFMAVMNNCKDLAQVRMHRPKQPGITDLTGNRSWLDKSSYA